MRIGIIFLIFLVFVSGCSHKDREAQEKIKKIAVDFTSYKIYDKERMRVQTPICHVEKVYPNDNEIKLEQRKSNNKAVWWEKAQIKGEWQVNYSCYGGDIKGSYLVILDNWTGITNLVNENSRRIDFNQASYKVTSLKNKDKRLERNWLVIKDETARAESCFTVLTIMAKQKQLYKPSKEEKTRMDSLYKEHDCGTPTDFKALLSNMDTE